MSCVPSRGDRERLRERDYRMFAPTGSAGMVPVAVHLSQLHGRVAEMGFAEQDKIVGGEGEFLGYLRHAHLAQHDFLQDAFFLLFREPVARGYAKGLLELPVERSGRHAR